MIRWHSCLHIDWGDELPLSLRSLFCKRHNPKAACTQSVAFQLLLGSTFASIANALLAWSKKELSGVNSATLHGVNGRLTN